MTASLSEQEFDRAADASLRALERALDAAGDGLEADLESGILTIEFSDGAKYVINSHRAARQIWMAAERSAWHFDWDADKRAWVAGKSGDELVATVEAVLGRKLGRAVALRA
ncbi:MAG TPA: iron donor protein CyaY [Minicystis sp.]|nr:iron donor protein CyaY [Minicystis sp.]